VTPRYFLLRFSSNSCEQGRHQGSGIGLLSQTFCLFVNKQTNIFIGISSYSRGKGLLQTAAKCIITEGEPREYIHPVKILYMNLGDNRVGRVCANYPVSCIGSIQIDSNVVFGLNWFESIHMYRVFQGLPVPACAGLDIFVNLTKPHFHCCTQV